MAPWFSYIPIVCGLFVIAFSQDRWQAHGLANLPIFVGVPAIGAGLFFIARSKWHIRYLNAIFSSGTIVCVFLWVYFGTYEQTMYKNEHQTEIYDTCSRWNNRLVSRKMYSKDNDWSASGEYSESGKQHGRWEYVAWKPKFEVETQYYWYGEAITEGEWHLRNKN